MLVLEGEKNPVLYGRIVQVLFLLRNATLLCLATKNDATEVLKHGQNDAAIPNEATPGSTGTREKRLRLRSNT